MLVLDSQSTTYVSVHSCITSRLPAYTSFAHHLSKRIANARQQLSTKQPEHRFNNVRPHLRRCQKSATRADVMMLAATTEAEFGKMRSWISARFDTVDADFAKVDARFDKMNSENTHNTNQLLRRNTAEVLSIAISAFESLRHSLPTSFSRSLVGATGLEPGTPTMSR